MTTKNRRKRKGRRGLGRRRPRAECVRSCRPAPARRERCVRFASFSRVSVAPAHAGGAVTPAGFAGLRRHGSAAAATAHGTPAGGKPADGAGPRADGAAEPGQERLPHKDLGRRQQVRRPPPASASCETRECAHVCALPEPAARASVPFCPASDLTCGRAVLNRTAGTKASGWTTK